jgi:hypothetical protein
MNQERIASTTDFSDFLTKCKVDYFLNSAFGSATPNSGLVKYRSASLKPGDHLVTSRYGYAHHGIFVGIDDPNEIESGKCVIHYSGLADSLKTGPIEKVSLGEFCGTSSYKVQHHDYLVHTREEAVQRAYKRLGESDYNLVLNNCEHFVNWCIENVGTSRQVNGVVKTGAKAFAKALGKSNAVTYVAITVAENVKCIHAYIKGDINKSKLFDELSHSAVTSTSMLWYGSLGQAAIPIPAIGFLVGSAVGFFVGNALHQSGHIALGETTAVREAKERRQEIEELCSTLIPEIQKSRLQLEQYIDRHFSERSAIFKATFAQMDSSILSEDTDKFVAALESINLQFGQTLQLKNFDEFDAMMKSKEAFQF